MKSRTGRKKAIVLLSGGLDSATVLYVALSKGYRPHCLIFEYGQRHRIEIEAAKTTAREARCPYTILSISLPWKGSSLLDAAMSAPGRTNSRAIPSTYVPARNILFLSYALSFAEALGAEAIFIGAHAFDYSRYPDCRPQFFRAFESVIRTGTKAGAEGRRIRVMTPLINMAKAEIVRLGTKLGVPFEHTWSCYRGGKRPCGTCDSCYYRAKGFREAGIVDRAL